MDPLHKFGNKIPAQTGLQVFRLDKLKFEPEVGLVDRTQDCAIACLSMPDSQCRGFSFRLGTWGDCHLFATPYVKGMLKNSFGATSYYDRMDYCVDDNGVSTHLTEISKVGKGTEPEQVCSTNALSILSYKSLLGAESSAIMQPATFGPASWQQFSELKVWLAMPSDGCHPMPPVSGGVLVVERGGCTFWEKVVNGQRAGAEAVIIVNNDGGSIVNAMSCNVEVDVGCQAIGIPSFYLHRRDWFEFKAVLRSSISPSGVNIGCEALTTTTTVTATTAPRPTTIVHEDSVCTVYVGWGSCMANAAFRPFMDIYCPGACYPTLFAEGRGLEDDDSQDGGESTAEQDDPFAVTTNFNETSDEFLSFVNPPRRISVQSDVIVVRIQYKTMYDTLKLHLSFLTPQPERQIFAKYTVRMREHNAEEEPEARVVEDSAGPLSSQEPIVTREPYSSIVEIELKLTTQLLANDNYQLEVTTWASGPRVNADILSSMTATGIAVFEPKPAPNEGGILPCNVDSNVGHLEECDEFYDQCCGGLVCSSSNLHFATPVCVVPDKGFGECYAAAQQCTYHDQCCSSRCSAKTYTCEEEGVDDALIVPPPRMFKDPLDPPAGTCYIGGSRCSRDYQCCDQKGCDSKVFQCMPFREGVSVAMSEEEIKLAYGDHSSEFRQLFEGTSCLEGSPHCIPSRIATAKVESSILFSLESAEGLYAARARCQKLCAENVACKGLYVFTNKRADTKCNALRDLGQYMPDGSYAYKPTDVQDYSYVKTAVVSGEVARTTQPPTPVLNLPAGSAITQIMTLRFQYNFENITTSKWIELASNLVGGMMNLEIVSPGEVSHIMRYGDVMAPQSVEPTTVVVAFSSIAGLGLADDAARFVRAKMWSSEGFVVTFGGESVSVLGAQSGSYISIDGAPVADTVSGVTFPPQITFPVNNNPVTALPRDAQPRGTTRSGLTYIIPTLPAKEEQRILDPAASTVLQQEEVAVKTEWVIVGLAIVGVLGMSLTIGILQRRRRNLLFGQIVEYSQMGSDTKSLRPVYANESPLHDRQQQSRRPDPFDLDWDMYDQPHTLTDVDPMYAETSSDGPLSRPMKSAQTLGKPGTPNQQMDQDALVEATLRALTGKPRTGLARTGGPEGTLPLHHQGLSLLDTYEDPEALVQATVRTMMQQAGQLNQKPGMAAAAASRPEGGKHGLPRDLLQTQNPVDVKGTVNDSGADYATPYNEAASTVDAPIYNDASAALTDAPAKDGPEGFPAPPPRSNPPPPLPPPNDPNSQKAIPAAIQHFMSNYN